jgi:signal transduction histidine kinase
MRRLRGSAFDALVAAGVGVMAQCEIWVEHVHPYWASAPVSVAQAAAIGFRRRAPLASTLVVFALFPLETAAGVSLTVPNYPIVILMLTLYSVALYAALRPALVGLVVPLLAIWLMLGLAVLRHVSDHTGGTDVVFVSVLMSASWLVGRAMRGRLHEAEELARRAERLETERVRAVADERARIARELHDVVAHSVSVMVVQAGAAEEVLRRTPGQALEALRAVQETGRQALVEMTRVVGLLRTDGEELGLAPQPGLRELETLVAQVREAGLPVEVRVEGARGPVPLGVDLSAYRIVQEALTNALKHAGRARASVSLRYGSEALELEVLDDGPGSANGHAGGHGLVGMRERVAVFGGEFEAGPRPEGGFAVRARLPLAGVEA